MMGITALSIDIMLPALPAIEAHYDLTDMNDQQLVIVSYMVGFGIGQLLFGPFSDRYGRKPILYFGMAVYMAATVAAVAALDFDTHLAGRLFQGVAAGAARVIAVAVVRDRFAGRAMARAMSFIMAIFILVPVVAPGIGAGILLIGPWQDIFWFLLGIAAILTLWTALRLKETRPKEARRPLTVRSFAGAAGAVLGNRQTLCYMATVSLTFGPLLALYRVVAPDFRRHLPDRRLVPGCIRWHRAVQPSDRDPLAHAAGQLVGIAVGGALQTDQPEILVRAPAALGLRHPAHAHAELDVAARGEPGEQRVFLEHDAAIRTGPVNGLAVETDLAVGGIDETGDQVEQGGLAAPRRADHADHLARRDLERDVLEGPGGRAVGGGEDLRYPLDFDQRGGPCGRARRRCRAPAS